MKKSLLYSPCILLAVVALIQIYLTQTTMLTPWKGGGFGMFASSDHAGTRGMSCEAIDVNHERSFCFIKFKGFGEWGPFTKMRWRNIRAFPTQGKLDSILEDYLNSEFINKKAKLTKRYGGPREKGQEDVSIKSLRLRMWRTGFDSKTGRIWPEEMGLVSTHGSFEVTKDEFYEKFKDFIEAQGG